MMTLSYDFEQFQPPHISERMVNAEIERRRALRRMALLAAASNLILISLALLALALSPYSMLASIICLGFLGIYISGSGVLTVLLANKLTRRYGKASALPFALYV